MAVSLDVNNDFLDGFTNEKPSHPFYLCLTVVNRFLAYFPGEKDRLDGIWPGSPK
jgi:hypothetical protein